MSTLTAIPWARRGYFVPAVATDLTPTDHADTSVFSIRKRTVLPEFFFEGQNSTETMNSTSTNFDHYIPNHPRSRPSTSTATEGSNLSGCCDLDSSWSDAQQSRVLYQTAMMAAGLTTMTALVLTKSAALRNGLGYLAAILLRSTARTAALWASTFGASMFNSLKALKFVKQLPSPVSNVRDANGIILPTGCFHVRVRMPSVYPAVLQSTGTTTTVQAEYRMRNIVAYWLEDVNGELCTNTGGTTAPLGIAPGLTQGFNGVFSSASRGTAIVTYSSSAWAADATNYGLNLRGPSDIEEIDILLDMPSWLSTTTLTSQPVALSVCLLQEQVFGADAQPSGYVAGVYPAINSELLPTNASNFLNFGAQYLDSACVQIRVDIEPTHTVWNGLAVPYTDGVTGRCVPDCPLF